MKRLLIALAALSACLSHGSPSPSRPLTAAVVTPGGLQHVVHDGSLQGNGTNTSSLGLISCVTTGQFLTYNTSTGWGCARRRRQSRTRPT